MSYKLPHTNADIRSTSIIMICNEYAAHALQSMSTSAKLLWGSIAACINGIIPHAFKYTTMSICLSIIEDDLQHNRVPLPTNRPQSSMLNDVIVTFDEEKMEKME